MLFQDDDAISSFGPSCDQISVMNLWFCMAAGRNDMRTRVTRAYAISPERRPASQMIACAESRKLRGAPSTEGRNEYVNSSPFAGSAGACVINDLSPRFLLAHEPALFSGPGI